MCGRVLGNSTFEDRHKVEFVLAVLCKSKKRKKSSKDRLKIVFFVSWIDGFNSVFRQKAPPKRAIRIASAWQKYRFS